MTAHSEYGTLKKVFIKSPEAAFRNQELINTQWKDLNYLGRPDFEQTKTEYQEFESLLKSVGTEIFYFSENETVSMDSIYCRDASIITDSGAIICHMGKGQRIPEPKACQIDYEKHGIPILGEITAPGTIEGGDVAWLDENTLAIAHGYRTNDEGFRQIKELLTPIGVDVIQVDLPHYKGSGDVFHLMSIFSPVDKHKAVVYSPLMPVRFREELLRREIKLIEVPDEEFESMACNVLAIAPSHCLMVKGNPITRQRLQEEGCTVVEYSGEDISVKGGGGPTCLTRPLLREL